MRSRMLCAVPLVLFAAPALAHETWISPATFYPKVGEEMRFDVTSGMAFPAQESAIQVDRVADCQFLEVNGEGPLLRFEAGETSLVLRHAFAKQGIATVYLDLKPREIELGDDKVEEYLNEIGASQALRERWAAQKGSVPWKETYTKHMKTFVSVGTGMTACVWANPVGSTLEIVPVSDPFAIAVGQELVAELRSDSQPFAGQSVGLMIEGGTDRVLKTTDAEGRVTFALPRAGRALLYAVWLRPAPDGKSWISDFSTVTFEVRSR